MRARQSWRSPPKRLGPQFHALMLFALRIERSIRIGLVALRSNDLEQIRSNCREAIALKCHARSN